MVVVKTYDNLFFLKNITQKNLLKHLEIHFQNHYCKSTFFNSSILYTLCPQFNKFLLITHI